MKEVFAFAFYLVIGFGVTIAYGERHGKAIDKETMLLGAFFWPGMVAADVYRAVFPAPSSTTGEAA